MSDGKVYLVGAGPGDPGLITVRAVECLGRADVVLYDYLANPDLLKHAVQAEAICLGRHGHTRIWLQEEINQRLVELARQGKSVVRLKSGDPAVFARGAEEVEYLAKQGIDFEIVPGITAALAAGSCAGIPVTHRDLASAVALVTGQQKGGKGTDLDYQALARFPGTLVFYMGVTTADEWVPALIGAGKPATTPVAIIRRVSFPDQQTHRCRLGELVTLISQRNVRPPVIVVIGDVAGLPDDLSWFEQRRLFGQSILVTRPIGQSRGLCDPLVELGAEVLAQPCIEINAPKDWSGVDQAISRLDQYDWLVFSSTNGVEFFMNRLLDRHDLRSLAGTQLAAVGPGTTAELARYHLRVDLQPDEYRAEALALSLAPHVNEKRVLLLRASRGREVLAEQLTRAGAIVEQVVTYESSDVESPLEGIRQRIIDGSIDWVTVTSSAIAKSLVHLFAESLAKTKLVSISPVTSATLRELGHEPACEAVTYDMPGVVAAIVASLN